MCVSEEERISTIYVEPRFTLNFKFVIINGRNEVIYMYMSHCFNFHRVSATQGEWNFPGAKLISKKEDN